ncbi:MAG: fructosamine kinase family protein [Cyanobacterium sp. T60_A2020_053]|nr:fructosamine kinase family protein [Cyanobacterium sp. T60_A2020_053]
MWTEIISALHRYTDFELVKTISVGGGCINQAYRLQGKNNSYFVKLNQPSAVDMFRVEAFALQEIYHTDTIKVPQPICWGATDKHSYLILQWLDMTKGNSQGWQKMGQNLALLHRVEGAEFGWGENNTIGTTPQINDYHHNWAEFFAEKRIGYQLKLARVKGAGFGNTEKIINAVYNQLSTHQPQPSPLHGDLWGGNAGFLSTNEPLIYDPAFYYGDREADIAMTELFGGFPPAFYQGYNQQWALNQGYQQRKIIYNLYHILNHFNLFGSTYSAQAQAMINQII